MYIYTFTTCTTVEASEARLGEIKQKEARRGNPRHKKEDWSRIGKKMLGGSRPNMGISQTKSRRHAKDPGRHLTKEARGRTKKGTSAKGDRLLIDRLLNASAVTAPTYLGLAQHENAAAMNSSIASTRCRLYGIPTGYSSEPSTPEMIEPRVEDNVASSFPRHF